MKDRDVLFLGKEFVTIKIALKIKELGFNEVCLAKYVGSSLLITTDNIYNTSEMPITLAPTWQRAIAWLEKEQNIIVEDRLYFSYEKQKWGVANYYHPDYINDKLTIFFKSKSAAIFYSLTNALNICSSDEENNDLFVTEIITNSEI